MPSVRPVLITAVTLVALFANVAQAAKSPAAARCDYARADYSVRELPFHEHNLAEYWAPGGRRMAYAEDGQIKVFDVKAWRTTAVLTEDAGLQASSPTWTTVGRIFFERRSGASPNPPEIYVMAKDGSNLKQVELSADFPRPPSTTVYYASRSAHAKISPDGSTAVFTTLRAGRWVLLKADIVYDGGEVRFERPVALNDDPYWNEVKGWSADGKAMLASSRGSEGDRRSLNADVFTHDLETGMIKRWTYDPGWDETADIGPGGALAFNSDRDVPAPYQVSQQVPLPNDFDYALVPTALVPITADMTTHEIYVAGPDGDRGWVRRLTFANGAGVSGSPKWSPDGRMVRFGHTSREDDTGHSMLLRFDCDRRGRRKFGA